jgi:hypothetical protein
VVAPPEFVKRSESLIQACRSIRRDLVQAEKNLLANGLHFSDVVVVGKIDLKDIRCSLGHSMLVI